MSDEEWDAKRTEPTVDKWAGEDDDSDVKEEWDKSDSEEENHLLIKQEPKQSSKKNCNGKAAMQVCGNSEKQVPLTEEEKLAEKLRMQKMEDDSKIQLAIDLLGLKENKIDNLVPETKEDFEQFGKAISEKIQTFSTSEHYMDLIENVTRDICLELKTATLKKLKIYLDNLISAKQKQEKMTKSKNKTKGIGVKMDLEKDIYGGGMGEGFDDMDDFM